MRKATLLGTALAIALLGFASPASAFCRLTTCQPTDSCEKDEQGCPAEGNPIVWTKMPIPYRLHSRTAPGWDYKKLFASIDAAFAHWENATCENGEKTSLRFERGADAQPNETDFPFSISMVNEGWPFDDSALAQTTHDFGKESGTIKNAVIQVNTASHEFVLATDASSTALSTASGADMESVLVHEIGHYIGLAHSEAVGSIMAPTYCQDEARCSRAKTSRELGPDDVKAVCTLYPPASRKPSFGSDPDGGNATSFGCTQSSSSDRSTAAVPLGVVVALAFVSARRRSARR